jgi:hypothetical protein
MSAEPWTPEILMEHHSKIQAKVTKKSKEKGDLITYFIHVVSQH